MKDLFVLTPDSDAQGLLRGLLGRHKALDIAPIEVKVERFFGRDAGIVKSGPEIIRSLRLKDEYRHVVLLWDRDGSGWEKKSRGEAMPAVQQRLDGVTWTDRSRAVDGAPPLAADSLGA